MPKPADGYWGSIMDFKVHPQTLLYDGNEQAFDANAIMAGRWDVNASYWVQLPFYLSWLLGTDQEDQPLIPQNSKIGVPLMNQVAGGQTAQCQLTQCKAYQRFSHGYIWQSAQGGVEIAVFCPDVVGSPFSSPWPDHIVDLFNDVYETIEHYYPGQYPGLPYESSLYAQFDVNGDGNVDLFTDIVAVINHHGMRCYPQ